MRERQIANLKAELDQHPLRALQDSAQSGEDKEEKSSQSSEDAVFRAILANKILQTFLPFLEDTQKSDLLFQEEYEAFVFFAAYIQCRYAGSLEDPDAPPPLKEFLQRLARNDRGLKEEDYYHLTHWGLLMIRSEPHREFFRWYKDLTLCKDLPPALFDNYSQYQSERDQEKGRTLQGRDERNQKMTSLDEELNKQCLKVLQDNARRGEEKEEKSSHSSRETGKGVACRTILANKILQTFLPFLKDNRKSDLLFQEEYEAFVFFATYIQYCYADFIKTGVGTTSPGVDSLDAFLQRLTENDGSLEEEDYYHLIDWGLELLKSTPVKKFLPREAILLKNLPPALFDDYSQYQHKRDQEKKSVYVDAVEPLFEARQRLERFSKKYPWWLSAFYCIPGIVFLLGLWRVAKFIYKKKWWQAFGTFFLSLIISVTPGLPAYGIYKAKKDRRLKLREETESWKRLNPSMEVRILAVADYKAHRSFRKKIKSEDGVMPSRDALPKAGSKARKFVCYYGDSRSQVIVVMDKEQDQRYQAYERWRTKPAQISPGEPHAFFENLNRSKLHSKQIVHNFFLEHQKKHPQPDEHRPSRQRMFRR